MYQGSLKVNLKKKTRFHPKDIINSISLFFFLGGGEDRYYLFWFCTF